MMNGMPTNEVPTLLGGMAKAELGRVPEVTLLRHHGYSVVLEQVN